MKQYWTKIELVNSWSLSQGEICYLEKKDNKLVYALKMRYFDLQGYLPKKAEDIPIVAIDYVASQLSITSSKVKDYDWHSRIAQIHNAEVREYYGFKKLEQADFLSIKEFVETDLLVQGSSIGQINDEVYKFLKKVKIEPSADNELSKYISNICTQYGIWFFSECKKHLSLTSQKQLNKLLGMYNNDQTILNFLRTPVGKVSTTTITQEQNRLSYIEKTGVVYKKFFNNIPRKLLKVYHDKIAISTPSRLLEIKDRDLNKFYGLLACFCKYKGARIIDNFIEILIRKLKKLEQFGKVKIKEELWKDYSKENKDELLNNLVDISLAHPAESVKYIIRKLVNATIAIRDKQIWGAIVNSFASDSTKFAAWSENLMT